MRDEDDGRSRGDVAHRVGDALDTLSIEELEARIALLVSEIVRIEAARETKKAALERAGSVFRL